jgi:hypothetical protein
MLSPKLSGEKKFLNFSRKEILMIFPRKIIIIMPSMPGKNLASYKELLHGNLLQNEI